MTTPTKPKTEIRDTTGNVLSPGQYGYEEQLAKQNQAQPPTPAKDRYGLTDEQKARLLPPTPTKAQHSPLPWSHYNISRGHIFKAWRVQDLHGNKVCSLTSDGTENNAAYIVEACNAYPQTVIDRDLAQLQADANWKAYKEAERLLNEAEAKAEKLAEAMDMATATIERLQRHAPGSAQGTLDVAKSTLAAYDKSKNPEFTWQPFGGITE